jgi:hypothetical protein
MYEFTHSRKKKSNGLISPGTLVYILTFKRLWFKGYNPSYVIMLWEFRSGFIVVIILILVTRGFCHWPVANTNKTKKSWSFVGKISRILDIWEKTILEK